MVEYYKTKNTYITFECQSWVKPLAPLETIQYYKNSKYKLIVNNGRIKKKRGNMQDRYPIGDDSALMRWMRTEINKVNESIVSERKSLSQLLLEEKPTAKTKTGKDHFFDTTTLRNLGEKLPKNLHDKLKVPILFFSDNKVPDSCYLNDAYALEALETLGEISRLRAMQQGRSWVGRSIAYSIMKKYPTVVQIVMG